MVSQIERTFGLISKNDLFLYKLSEFSEHETEQKVQCKNRSIQMSAIKYEKLNFSMFFSHSKRVTQKTEAVEAQTVQRSRTKKTQKEMN